MSLSIHAAPSRAAAHVARMPVTSLAKATTRFFIQTARQQTQLRTEEREEVPASLNLSEMSSLAHAELETHRELRAMARTAAWEMPLLSALSKPFEPPTEAVPLRWRYTTYFGELHPAASKVVVEFGVKDLKHINEAQQTTLRKLAGARWDPVTDMIKMSCEAFPNQAQNKRYLGETIANLIKEAVEGKDKFEDIPLDDRHAVKRNKKRTTAFPVSRFPKEWFITPERRAYLDAKREVQAKEIEAPATTDEQAALAALKQAAIESGEIASDAIAETVPATQQNAPFRPQRAAISGIDAIAAAKKKEQAKVKPETNAIRQNPTLRSAPLGTRGRR